MAAGHVPELKRRPFWLVDPLDGTKEFIKRNGEFTVNIALIENGRPTLGIVLAPVPRHAVARRRRARRRQEREGRRLHADHDARTPPPAGLTACASRSHAIYSDLDIWFRSNGLTVAERMQAGSSLKFCLIAEGKADIYPRFGPTNEWDTAAGQGVLEAAGGEVVTTDDRPLALRQAALLAIRTSSPAARRRDERIARGRAAHPRGRAGRLSDRDGLRPGRRRHQRARRRGDLRGQGPAAVQSADLPRARTPPRRSASCEWNETADKLAARFWPGPLTLVLPRAKGSPIALLATAGLDTVAIRAPAHPMAQALIRAAGRPIAAPSANRSGAVSPTRAEHVAESLGDRGADDPRRRAVHGRRRIRRCSISRPQRADPAASRRRHARGDRGGDRPDRAERRPSVGDAARKSPGQLDSHYAPARPVRLDATTVAADEGLLAFGPALPAGARLTLNLSPRGDLAEAAANLFAMLRALDRPEIGRIAVMPIPETGLGLAINDRLRRAAADDGTGRRRLGSPQERGNDARYRHPPPFRPCR